MDLNQMKIQLASHMNGCAILQNLIIRDNYLLKEDNE